MSHTMMRTEYFKAPHPHPQGPSPRSGKGPLRGVRLASQALQDFSRRRSLTSTAAASMTAAATATPQQLSQSTLSTPTSARNQVMTILNTLHPELFVPYRHMGFNMFDTIRTAYPFIYRINDGTSNNTVLQKVCEERGWQEFKDFQKAGVSRAEREIYESSNWNLWWSYNFYQGSPYRTLKCWQYTNHNPRGFQFCSKSYLVSFLRRLKAEFGDAYNFGPKSFVMPEEYILFISEHSKRQEGEVKDAKNIGGSELFSLLTTNNTNSNTNTASGSGDRSSGGTIAKTEIKFPVWIIKPIGRSQGKGIVLTKDIGHVAGAHKCVVQEYICKPHLIAGYKWDMRIYVLIASTDPLCIYMYREGLCRFATEKFSLSDLEACYSHLTNASLNKMGPSYPNDKEVIGMGCKWSLQQLREHLRKNGKASVKGPGVGLGAGAGQRDWLLWQKIMALVVLTVAGEGLKAGYVYPGNRNCFDFFGFDILIDEQWNPYLLEVNYSPGLGGDCPVDEVVKGPMLHELFDLLGFPAKNGGPDFSKPGDPKSSPRFPANANNPVADVAAAAAAQKPRLTLDCSKVDVTSKGRLDQASLIYSQDLVLEYFGKYCRNPNFRLSPTMKIMYERKVALAKRRRRFKKLLEEMRKDNTGDDSESTASEVSSTASTTSASSATSEENAVLREYQRKLRREAGDRKEAKMVKGGGNEMEKEEKYIYLHRQDWNEAPLRCGKWTLVYPCKALPFMRSPYRSAVGDLRGVVKGIENYMKVAESVVKTYPEESDEFYESKVKALTRWDIDVWAPPRQKEEEGIIPILR